MAMVSSPFSSFPYFDISCFESSLKKCLEKDLHDRVTLGKDLHDPESLGKDHMGLQKDARDRVGLGH